MAKVSLLRMFCSLLLQFQLDLMVSPILSKMLLLDKCILSGSLTNISLILSVPISCTPSLAPVLICMLFYIELSEGCPMLFDPIGRSPSILEEDILLALSGRLRPLQKPESKLENLFSCISLLVLSKYLTEFLGAHNQIRTTDASLIVISQSSCSSNTNCHSLLEINVLFFLKKSMFLEIFTLEKSQDNPQKEPSMLSPPAFDSDSLEDKSENSIGRTRVLSFYTYSYPT